MRKSKWPKAQITLLDKIYVDCFAGGGGWSTGFELATGRVINIAINHSIDAIRMHKTNHPYTEHYQEDVFVVDPKTATHGQQVGWAHFSPDCKHFSRAKGGPLVDRKIRGLAWVVLHWADQVRPDIISLENVVEFQGWGPLMEVTLPSGRKGTIPDPERQGEYFAAFVGMLTTGVAPDCPALDEVCECMRLKRNSPEVHRLVHGLGYQVEWRELVAADYGAPTTRKRFFMVARCDGRPIVWPGPTHAPADSEEVKAGRKRPWRSAAEIIDWSLPCPSIFDTKEEIRAKYGLKTQRPLRPNTMRRVARGVDKFVIKAANPFLVHCKFDNAPEPVSDPLRTVTSVNAHLLTDPVMAPWTVTNTTNSTGHPVNEPIDTARTGGGGGQMFVGASLVQYHTERTERVRGQAVTEPIMTIDASNRYGLAAATLTKYYSGPDQNQDVAQPLHTITTKPREGVTMAHMVKLNHDDVGEPVTDPVPTITASGGHHGLVITRVEKVTPGVDLQRWPQIRAALNEYCGYHLADDEVILFQIGGAWYFMADIGLRMLSPRELYRANGFPDDYIIDRDYLGNDYPKSEQVARCGNAVPPPFATALVRANLPEWCGREITTMAELEKAVAV